MTPSKKDLKANKPLWVRALITALFIVLGIVIAFPIFSITYYSMVRTSGLPPLTGPFKELESG